MQQSGLTVQEIEKIRQVFNRFPEIEKAMIYGSRAMGTFKPASDIDLTLIGDDLNLSLLHALEAELDDLLLPYKIDLSDFKQISNPDLINHIKRVGKEFYIKR